MGLNEEPQFIIWPETHFLFVEGIGPFMTSAPQSWQKFHMHLLVLRAQYTITGFMSLYKIGPLIYRAGVAVSEPAGDLPEGFRSTNFSGGRYALFTLKGSYAQLPEATGRAWQIVSEKGLTVRDDFAIENYTNNPATTAEADLISEILIPVLD
jgi:predicted transcriptional regulator YdeE